MQVNVSELCKLDTLFKNENYELYAVGGCVRDLLLGKNPKDFDFATNATPDQMKDLCNKYGLIYYPTGEQYGTITIKVDYDYFEVTTYRQDVFNKAIGEHRPSGVIFSKNLQDDLSRRDFTINAMALPVDNLCCFSEGNHNSVEEYLIDPFNGRQDLIDGIIKCVGNPVERFKEDGLRIMRAIRFAMKYDFQIEKNTMNAIYENHHCLDNISKERISSEFSQMLNYFHNTSNEVGSIVDKMFYEKYKMFAFIIKKIIPEMEELAKVNHNSNYHLFDIFTHSLLVTASIPTDYLPLRLAALFHDVGKMKCITYDENKLVNHFYAHPVESVKIAEKILRDLRFSNDIIKQTLTLIEFHDAEINITPKSVKKNIKNVGIGLFPYFMTLKKYDRVNHIGVDQVAELEKYTKIMEIYHEIKNNEEAFSIKDLVINGYDLLELGYKEGPVIKTVLNECLDIVMENPSCNTREQLLFYCKNFLTNIQEQEAIT